MTHHGMQHGMKKGWAGCPHCGCQGHKEMSPKKHMKMMAKKAWKKTIINKMAAEIEARHADKLDKMAKELVDIGDEKMKMKAEMWKKKEKIKETFWSIFEEE